MMPVNKNNSVPRVILADMPVIKNMLREFPHPNMGILYLSAYVKALLGKDVKIFYLEPFLSLSEHLKRVQEIQPLIYGISFPSFFKKEILKTIRAVKDISPDTLIIAGGAHPTVMPEDCLKDGIDLVVLGEGEKTFADTVKRYCIERKNSFDDIPGLAYFKNETFYKTADRKLIEDLDFLPVPDWDIASWRKYTGAAKVKRLPYGVCVISRGCPFNCNFCSNPVWKYSRPWVRLRSPLNIAKEIDYLYKKGFREIQLLCDEFNPNLSWAKEVCKEILRLRYDNLYFNTLVKASPIDEEFCSLLKEMNCYSVNIGIESANERVLKGIEKSITLEEVVEACRLLRRYKIRVFGNFMIFNIWEESGVVKFETKDEAYNTLQFADSLLRQGLINNMSWGFVSPMPGSKLYNTCLKYNLIDKNSYLVSKYDKPVVAIPDASDKELKRLKRQGYIMQAYYTFKNDLSYLNLRNYGHILNRIIYLIK